jgi:DNA-directed RNA polymerase specialized sigma24 family protein
LYESGLSCKEIAKEFGCSSVGILKILQKHDVKRRPKSSRGKFSEEICQKMIDLYHQGHTQESIAARFGCSEKILKRIFDEHDVKRRPNQTQSQSRFTKQDHRRMVSMYQKGKSQREIAEEFGCRPFAMTRIFKKLGVERRPAPPHHQITQEDRELILKLRGQGRSYSEIAAKIGCCRETVGVILHRLNEPIRVQGPDAYSDEDQRRMVESYESGMSLDEIAVGFECGRQTVKSVMQKHGVKIRERGFVGQLTPKKRARILTMYEAGCSGAEIAKKFNCGLATVASVIGLATRKSEIVERITSLSPPKTPNKSAQNIESPADVAAPKIPFETLVRNFWTNESRAVDVLLKPPEHRQLITENVAQALAYAYKTLGKQDCSDNRND